MFRYSDEMISFLRNNIASMSYRELAIQFNIRFTTQKNYESIKTLCLRFGINRGCKKFEYTQEMLLFLKENSFGRSRKELTDHFNAKFETTQTIKEISSVCNKHKYYSIDRSEYYFTDEMVSFLEKNVKSNKWDEITKKFNSHFSTSKSTSAIKSSCVRSFGFVNGLPNCTCLENKKHPLGTERIYHGYIVIKTAQPNIWTPKHILLWEQKNGPVPDGYCIIFADGDRTNFSENNLIKVSRKELYHLNIRKLRFSDPEYTKVGLNIAKIFIKAKERQKEIDDEKSKEKNQQEEA